jgi:hypothetical protein
MRGLLVRIELGIISALLGTACMPLPVSIMDTSKGTLQAAAVSQPPPQDLLAPRSMSQPDLDGVNTALRGKEVTVTIVGASGAQSVQVKDVNVGRETTRWLELQPGSNEPGPRSVATEALQQITIVKRGRGALVGFGIGGAVGMLAGALIGLEASGSSGRTGDVPNFGPVVIFVVGAAVGIVAGTFIGALVGQRTTVEFCPAPLVPALVSAPKAIFAGPDAMKILSSLGEDTWLCFDDSPDHGFHRVQLPDGRIGFVLPSGVTRGR